MSTSGPRRSDALRNRERLIAEADALFRSSAEPVRLEMIARAAGVGIGTLYRHFPTRDALVEEIYRFELDGLTAQATELLATDAAFVALRRWIGLYVDFVAAKRAMRDSLRAAVTPDVSHNPIRARVTAIMGDFLEAGIRDGTLRAGLLPGDVTLGMLGMVLAVGAASDAAQADRVLRVLMHGLRGPAAPEGLSGNGSPNG